MKKQEILNQEENDMDLSALASTFASVYQGNSKQISYSDTYSFIYKLCKKGQVEEILRELKNTSISHFAVLLTQISNQEKSAAQYIQMFDEVQQAIDRLSQVLLYVDSNYIGNSKRQHTSIKQILNSIFFTQIYENKTILLNISKLIALSRCNQSETQILKLIQAINSLDEKEVFLPELLAPIYQNAISAHFTRIFQEAYATSSLPSFLQCARLKIQEERQWMQKHFLRAKGKKVIEQLLKKIYFYSFEEIKLKIYQEKSEEIFEQAALPFLQMLNQKNQLKEINDFNDWYIEQVKKRLVKIDRANNSKFLKEFVKQYLFVSGCLSGVKGFNIGYKVTFFFEHWINEEKICLPRRLNIYFEDLILKNEANTEDLNNFIVLFKFLKEKDYFEKQFRRACALRMIYDPTKSKNQMESSMVNQMSNQCGSDWVEKIEKLKIATEESEALRETNSTIFNAIVIQDSVWPFPKLKHTPGISATLLSLSDGYKAKYEQKYKGRSLEWHPLQGFAVLNIKFSKQVQQFKVDTATATILLNLQQLQFKSTVRDVLKATNMCLEDVIDQLQQLQREKVIKIQNSLKGSDLEKSGIELNIEYEVKEQKGVIDFTNRYLEEEFTEKHGHEELKAERKMMVEAFIVKIMKANKTITMAQMHEQISPMIEARGFKFNSVFVDNAFAALIDKRYIKDLEDGSYSYLAS